MKSDEGSYLAGRLLDILYKVPLMRFLYDLENLFEMYQKDLSKNSAVCFVTRAVKILGPVLYIGT